MTDFDILGVPPGASREEIKAAYRRKARALHPDVTGGAPAPGTTEAFLQLTEARRRALAVRTVTDAAVFAQARRSGRPVVSEPARSSFPAQRRGAATGRTPTHDDDPMLTLLTLPQRCAGTWPAQALEVWALTVVPAARAHLAEARCVVAEAGVALPRQRAVATAHVLLTLTLSARATRRHAPLADRLRAAYSTLERELPKTVVARLPERATVVLPRRSTAVVAAGAGALLGGLVVWAEGPGRLLG
jgi:hypothetical protein